MSATASASARAPATARAPAPASAAETRRAALAGLPEIDRPTRVSTDEAQTLSAALLVRLRELEPGTPAHAYVRNTLVELNLSLVRFAARRFRNRPEQREDIVQVGTIGLIKAIDRFDPDRGIEFSAFALPTVVGEMKRFFRDTSWAVRVPRRLQELRIDLARTSDLLEQRHGHRPSRAEVADHLQIGVAAVAEGELAARGYTARSLDVAFSEDDDAPPLVSRRLAAPEPSYDLIEDLTALKPLIARMGERDRRILSLRFGQELTQAQIGERLGLSQMHISRLLTRILDELRAGLLADDGAAVPPRHA
ncbi:SigB/SigF/SigG family RNA polymerase sigma factor [Streptomyces sp. SKN60]|uniref:SigB/SigF/SigG family RNA polymerase sigma factor n=1 Tax=Streptomyces sp. SKN60 TaxID=2855506 RepID=UPI002248451F|nr:SigB/SigF/SigG family RNA polymerase sigma factor [Streptomyces sp. SKN60]MCX2180618.1 SigB/SigF/SigG family RNA polymerase sigma factor [Streptomyces sp. SKN60]